MSHQRIIPSSPCNHSLMSNMENGEEKTFTEHPVWDCTPPHGNFLTNSGRDIINGWIGSNTSLAWESYLLDPVRIKADNERQCEDDESVNFKSNREIEDDAGASSGEFYDARDELSSDGEEQSSIFIIETELKEMRSILLKEIERRKQAEETLEKMQLHWRKLREQLADVSIFLPLDPTTSQYRLNLADEFRCQLEVAKFVSDSLDSDLANAEVEMEVASEIEAKNFEITRLCNRLHYYEIVNQEMSQRNQEATGRRKRRERLIWGSIAATITLSVAVLASTYLPVGGSSLLDLAQSQETLAS